MRRILRWSLRVGLLLLVLVGGVLAWHRDELHRLLAVNSLFAEDRIVANFSAMDRLFFHAALPVDVGTTVPLEVAPRRLPELSGWLQARSVTAIVVLKDGAVAYERYRLGTSAADRRISWSMAKSFLSALFGILHAEGVIADLDEPVTRYAPTLAGTAYDGVSIRNVLQMSSGVRFDEDYFDFHSDINRMGRVLALGGSMDAFAASLSEREREPGQAWQYVSIDTHVIGMVIRGASGRGIGELLAERLLQPIGVESSPYYVTDGDGTAFVLGGLNMSTRDYARFGQLFLQRGVWDGHQVVPSDWVDESTRASANTAPGRIGYGYQWWVPVDATEGEFLARGVYGQFIYVNRPAGVVVALNSADRSFAAAGVFADTLARFREIAATLHGSAETTAAHTAVAAPTANAVD